MSSQFFLPIFVNPGRFSNGGEERISGVEKLTNGDGEEELKRQSIDKVNMRKREFYILLQFDTYLLFREIIMGVTTCDLFPLQVDDLLAMLDREGGDSPSPEDEIDGGLSIDEVERMKIVYFG